MQTKTYAVTYRDSKNKSHVEFVKAETMQTAAAKVQAASVTVEGMGGKFVSCAEVTKVERVG